MYQSAAALWLKLQSAVAELHRHQLAAIMPGGFDIAMEHICIEPSVDFVDYGRLEVTSRFGAYNVTHGGAVAELLRRHAVFCQRGFDLAVLHICRYYFLDWKDYDKLHASSLFCRDTVYVGLFGNVLDVASDYDSSTESETSTAV